MSLVNISNIRVNNATAPFLSPLSFTVVVETLKQFNNPIEFKFTYIGSATNEKFDQVLDAFEVGPLPPGVGQFDCEINPPDPSKIPVSDLLGITAMTITVSFKGKEFFRVGYYIYNGIPELEQIDGVVIPAEIDLNRVERSILHEKPKIVNYTIDWEEQEKDMMLMNEILGGAQDANKANQNFLSFSDNSINFNGIFNNSNKSNDNFAKPMSMGFGTTNPFNNFGGGLFDASNNNNTAATGFNSGTNNSNNCGLNGNNFNPFANQQYQQFGKENIGGMPANPQNQAGYFDAPKSAFDMGLGQYPQQHQPGTGPSFNLFGQNYQ